MYMSVAQSRIREDVIPHIGETYKRIVHLRLKVADGCHYAWFVKHREHHDEFLTISLWETREHIERFASSQEYADMMEELGAVMAESSEWETTLSEDLTLRFGPVPEKPVIAAYNVAAMDGAFISPVTPMFLRIVSMDVNPSKEDEFVKRYERDVLPALHEVKGCRAVFLTERKKAHHYLSVTLWDSRLDCDTYENGGLFEDLVEKLRPTFSVLARMKDHKGMASRTVTTEDLRVDQYEMIVAEPF